LRSKVDKSVRDAMALRTTNLAKCYLYYCVVIFKSLVHTHGLLTFTLISAHVLVTVSSRLAQVQESYFLPLSKFVCSHRRSRQNHGAPKRRNELLEKKM